jgi:hypothetical protein
MTEAIPLCATLRTQLIDIVEGHVFYQCFDGMFKFFTIKAGCLGVSNGRLLSQ